MTQTTLERGPVRELLRSSTWHNLILAVQLVVGLAYAYVTGDIGSRLTHFVIPFIW